VKRIRRILFPLLLLLLVSCATESTLPHPASEEIREDASVIAEKYLGMPYEWGGQSFWNEETGTVDCSGLVINVYKEACTRYGRQLTFADTTARMLHERYTVSVTIPEKGDLIFMGDNKTVSHVALFRGFFGNQIEFLDASSADGKVMIRRYDRTNRKILSFGRILVR
jgi:cell wall-associated NlpC family hydrolase